MKNKTDLPITLKITSPLYKPIDPHRGGATVRDKGIEGKFEEFKYNSRTAILLPRTLLSRFEICPNGAFVVFRFYICFIFRNRRINELDCQTSIATLVNLKISVKQRKCTVNENLFLLLYFQSNTGFVTQPHWHNPGGKQWIRNRTRARIS